MRVISLFIAIVSGVAVGGLLRVTHVFHSATGFVLPALAAFVGALFLVNRSVSGKVKPLVDEAQRHLTGGRRELGVASLRAALKFSPWQLLLEGQLRAQLGILSYVGGDVDGALAELTRATTRSWEAQAFLGCARFKRRDDDKSMCSAFEHAVKAGKTEGLAWTVYAWCLLARSRKDDAVKVLKRGIEKMPADQRLKGNLELVEEGKKMKVAPYGDRWAAFGLDGGGPAVPKAARGFAQRPGFRQKPLRRKK
jgi:hypothetical protein